MFIIYLTPGRLTTPFRTLSATFILLFEVTTEKGTFAQTLPSIIEGHAYLGIINVTKSYLPGM